MIHAYARLDRTGLGNMLFPWARAEVFRRDMRCPALAPSWTQWMRIGPWLRRERDKRLYRHVFSTAGYVSGVRKAWLLATRRKIDERDLQSGTPSSRDRCIVEFRGMEGLFEPFATERSFIRQRLQEILCPWVRDVVAREWPADRDFIAVHVRRGDFQPWDPRKASTDFMSMQLPVEWYVAAVRRAQEIAGDGAETLVFTDGDGAELGGLLARPRTRLAAGAPAICHILAMSNARAIIGSASSFSMWAAYLSTAPAVWFPGVRPPPRESPGLNSFQQFESPAR
jgi:hypothetical protein